MKVLVATGQTQGTRHDDHHHAIEGELVRVGEVPLTRAEYVEADDLADHVADWPVGTITERRLEFLHVRLLPSELPA